MTTLFVSPHFDDVAWSCVAHVRASRQQGRVLVATVFGHGQTVRQQEDARAMALLGCEPLAFPFHDAPERLGVAPSFASLLLTRYEREPHDRQALVRVLRDLVARESITHVVFPLGVGGHVDHRVTHSAQDAWQAAPSISFYEDQPYAQVRGALAARLVQVGARLEAPLPLATAAEVESSAREVFAGLIDPRRDTDGLAALATAFSSPHLDPTPGTALGPLHPHRLPSDHDVTEEALRCYATEFPRWFPSDEHLRRFTSSRPVETLWARDG